MNKNKYKQLIIFISLLILVGVFGITKITYAGPIDWVVGSLLGLISQLVLFVCGMVLSLTITGIVAISKYNNFVNEQVIINAWAIVRDFCNMFFVLIFLVIAFATILRVESYQLKKVLPKLIIMAVLINFSKTICGLMIDFSQVIMITFVNAFGTGNGASFIDSLQINKFLAITDSTTDATKQVKDFFAGEKDVNLTSVVGAYMLAIAFMLVATITLLAILVVFLMRMIMLWIYIVLSPLAFLLSAFPQGAKYASQYWGEFTKYLINGPVLAFFVWLALMTAQSIDDFGSGGYFIGGDDFIPGGDASIIAITETQSFLGFIIAIGMLVGGLMVSQQIGGIGSAWGAGMVKNLGSTAGNWAKRGALLSAKGGLGLGAWGARKLKAGKLGAWGKGLELNPMNYYRGIQTALEKGKRDEIIEGTAASAESWKDGGVMGLVKGLGASRDAAESMAKGILWNKGLGVAKKVVKSKGIREKIEAAEKEVETAEDNDDVDAWEAANKNLETLREKHKEDLQVPFAYYANQDMMALTNEEKQKLGDNDNEDVLVDAMHSGMNRGDKQAAMSTFLHMASVGHSNEVLEKTKAKRDVYNDKGEVVTAAGQNFIANNAGLKAFVEQYMIEGLKMGKQEAFTYVSQFSTLAKKAKHFNLAEAIGLKDGKLFHRSDADQSARANGEIAKLDSERVARDLNRLGNGGEIQTTHNGETDRVMVLDALSEKNFIKFAGTYNMEFNKRKRANTNFSTNAFKNFAVSQNQTDDDLKGLPMKLKNYLDIAKGYEGQTFTTEDGKNKTYVQLALDMLATGKEKYYSQRTSEIMEEKMESKRNIMLDKLEKERKKMEKILDKEAELANYTPLSQDETQLTEKEKKKEKKK